MQTHKILRFFAPTRRDIFPPDGDEGAGEHKALFAVRENTRFNIEELHSSGESLINICCASVLTQAARATRQRVVPQN
jgi:hypothetical protein